MTRRRSLLVVVSLLGTAALLAAVTYLLPRGRPAEPSAQTSAGTDLIGGALGSADPAGAASSAETARLVRAFERRVHARPSAPELTFLAQLYLRQGRLSGDADTYARAETALQRAHRMSPRYLPTTTLLAQTKATLHDFPTALALARSVLQADRTQASALAVAGDAALETGDYGAARTAYDRLGSAAPATAAVLVRRARLAWIDGDAATARALAARATAAAVTAGETGPALAFYRTYEAQLALDTGAYADADRLAAAAVDAAPSWHVALGERAKVLAALQRWPEAAAAYRQAIAVVPMPDYLAGLGDVLTRSGDPRAGALQYGAVDVAARIATATGLLYNRQLVLFDADHGRNTAEAVRLARAELRTRRDVGGWDALGWALLADGRPDEAWAAAQRALERRTPDPRFLYHAGMAAAARHDTATAVSLLERALAASPEFDPLQAPRARAALARLTGGRS